MRKEEEEGVRRSNEEKEQRKSLALDNIGIYMYIYQSRRREEGGGPKVPGFQGLEVVYCHLRVSSELGLDSKEGQSCLLIHDNFLTYHFKCIQKHQEVVEIFSDFCS